MAYASAVDIADRLGRDLDDLEARIVETRLDDVEALIKTRVPDLDDKITDGKLNQRLVIMVEADALLRLIRNPDGFTQETDGNYSYSIDARVASGRLSLLPEEWGLLGVSTGIALIVPKITLPSGTGCRCNPNHPFESGLPWDGCTCDWAPSDDTAVWA